jgi:hypothetical protein
MAWIAQYPKKHRKPLLALLERVQFLDKSFVENALVRQNSKILARLRDDGIGLDQVIYLQHDDAGSSSAVMLNLLRDKALLERRGATLLDAQNAQGLSRATDRINYGAIVIVDDFAGTGKQLIDSYSNAAAYIAGSFTVFFLAVAICEEALEPLQSVGVEPVADIVHRKIDRPLGTGCTTFPAADRDVLLELGKTIDRHPLGFRGVGSNIVFYRNAPNTTPVLLRGNVNQNPLIGVLPRTTDLAVVED